jgi:hypothetical protein
MKTNLHLLELGLDSNVQYSSHGKGLATWMGVISSKNGQECTILRM